MTMTITFPDKHTEVRPDETAVIALMKEAAEMRCRIDFSDFSNLVFVPVKERAQ